MHPLTIFFLALAPTFALALTCIPPTERSPVKDEVKTALAGFLLKCPSNPPRIPPGDGCSEYFAIHQKAAIRACPGSNSSRDGINISCKDIAMGVEIVMLNCDRGGYVGGKEYMGDDSVKDLRKEYVVVEPNYLYQKPARV